MYNEAKKRWSEQIADHRRTIASVLLEATLKFF